jgi:hypothetical protein
MDSSLCVRTMHNPVCRECLRSAPYVLGHYCCSTCVCLMSLVIIVAVLVCALCPWSLLLQYLCAPYVLGRSLLAATCCVPLSSCGNLRGGVLLVVGWRRRVKCVCYFYKPKFHKLKLFYLKKLLKCYINHIKSLEI